MCCECCECYAVVGFLGLLERVGMCFDVLLGLLGCDGIAGGAGMLLAILNFDQHAGQQWLCDTPRLVVSARLRGHKTNPSINQFDSINSNQPIVGEYINSNQSIYQSLIVR